MNTVLIILGMLGLGAMMIAAYVFTVAARKYVSNHNHQARRGGAAPSENAPQISRNGADRRQKAVVQSFPITVNGALVEEDRRHIPDRRLAA
jgi:hypothetical protein